jgi:ATP-dependent RNA helicase DDX31/DBP7
MDELLNSIAGESAAALDHDTSLGLNIVTIPRQTSVSKTGSHQQAQGGNSKKKRETKYERRRRKAAQAKVPIHKTPETATGDASGTKVESDAIMSEDVAAPASPSVEAIVDAVEINMNSVDGEASDAVDDDEIDNNEDVGTEPLSANVRNTGTIRGHPGSIEEEAATEARAQYLREFHARPLELDRRAGAHVVRHVKGRTSRHLFQMDCDEESHGEAVNRQGSSTAAQNRTDTDSPVKESSGKDSASRTGPIVRDWETARHYLHGKLVETIRQSPHFCLEQPTRIQSRAIPAFSRRRREGPIGEAMKPPKHNILIQCETGSGKTLAYLLPLLHALAIQDQVTHDDSRRELRRMERTSFGTRAIILCPTRELAVQTFSVVENLCRSTYHWIVPGCLTGEERRKSEKARIRKGLGIVIATPGRLLDHLQRTDSLLLALKGKLEWFVLDEADRLLDEMGLGDQVTAIVQRLRVNQQARFRSVIVSATVTKKVEELAQSVLSPGPTKAKEADADYWEFVTGGITPKDKGRQLIVKDGDIPSEPPRADADHPPEHSLTESTPRQLSHLHVTVSAKLRLVTLVAFLTQRVLAGDRMVVFLSTCASVDFHHALMTSMSSILDEDQASRQVGKAETGAGLDSSGNSTSKKPADTGLFGERCPILRLHGSVPHGERQLVLKRFANAATTTDEGDGSQSGSRRRSAILLATDVAARGLNLHEVDWTVQYDPPSEVSDYVHRAGRVARAGRAGHSLLFLLPSEKEFLSVLKQRGVRNLTAYSLASTLSKAAELCSSITSSGVKQAGGSLDRELGNHRKNPIAGSRLGEAWSSELQRRMEMRVTQDDNLARAARKEALKGAKKARPSDGSIPSRIGTSESGKLSEMARKAFLSHIRAYPTKEKPLRPIFVTKALHFGHLARSFALQEAPKKLVSRTKAEEGNSPSISKRKRSTLVFESLNEVPKEDSIDNRAMTIPSKKPRHVRDGDLKPKDKRAWLLENASRLQRNGLDAL